MDGGGCLALWGSLDKVATQGQMVAATGEVIIASSLRLMEGGLNFEGTRKAGVH